MSVAAGIESTAFDRAYAEGLAIGRAYRAASARVSVAEHERIDRILRKGPSGPDDRTFFDGLRGGGGDRRESMQSVADGREEAPHGSRRL
jgi:hypothetical protein